MELIKLTQFSRGAGCGCKIAPSVLEEILSGNITMPDNDKLWVGNHSKDDAAVYDLGDGTALITTTDFFMPIVDEAFDFGRVASANAISDVYAMGGKPIIAIAVLGWPVDKIPLAHAQKIIEDSKTICKEAGIPLAGGHSIDSAEPFFGLAVNGLVKIENLKKNNTAQDGDMIFITKPIGVGILSTAHKRGVLKEEDYPILVQQMSTLNKVGEALGKVKGVTALTDVTGFGLLGHLLEMTEQSGLSATIEYNKIPVIPEAKEYLSQNMIPDATYRNWNSYGDKVDFDSSINVMEAFNLLPDPQTNGGLLIAADKTATNEVMEILQQFGLSAYTRPIGRFSVGGDKPVKFVP